jgi:Predicted nucleotidyltransferases
MTSGLPAYALDSIVAICRSNPGVKRALLYGSRAKGCARPNSDIDISLDAPGLSYRDLVSIETRLDDLLLPWKIDLSLLHQIENPALLEHIGKVGIDLLAR